MNPKSAKTFAAALFIDPNGPYSEVDGLDLWDKSRDARLYSGPYPVIAHPPCNRWGKMAPINYKRWGTQIGEDGGCFESALKSVRSYGGVLEHPSQSLAWKSFELLKPKFGIWTQLSSNEWVAEVNQSDYGHLSTKKTWLFFVGNKPTPVKSVGSKGKYQIGGGVNTGNNKKPRLNQKLTHLTPKPFRDYLIKLVKECV
jgi:hypothetical protein